MRYRRWIGVLAVLLVACGSPAAVPTAAVTPIGATPTEVPQPTATTAPIPTIVPADAPTSVPLSAIDLEPLVLKSGDLPSSWAGGQIRDEAPGAYVQMKVPLPADKTLFQLLEEGGEVHGSVVISLYKDDQKRETAYAAVAHDLVVAGKGKARTPDDIGEKATLLEAEGLMTSSSIVFVRCSALISFILGKTDAETVSGYAKRLDKRLTNVVC